MFQRSVLFVWLIPAALFAGTAAKVDFARDVQPLFKKNCIGCHGPSMQMNGFRLDRRRDAMRGGTVVDIGPGNGAASRLYLRLIGSRYGLQMPPMGPLSQHDIDTIKAWIDQGAEWPDHLSGDEPIPNPDPDATRMMEAIRTGNGSSLAELLAGHRKAVNEHGPGGSTPLIYATLYGDVHSMEQLLKAGADPKLASLSGVTPLMTAASGLDKTGLLLASGAEVNARSRDGRTALMVAAGRRGSADVVKLLLDHGAKVDVSSALVRGKVTALTLAAGQGDDRVMRLLLDHGAEVKSAGPMAFRLAMNAGCAKCVDLLLASAPPALLTRAMLLMAPPLGDAGRTKLFLDHGADPNARDEEGQTILMLAASSDSVPVEAARALIERGADVNAKTPTGRTALDFARLRGETPLVDLLVKAGAATGEAGSEPTAKPKPAPSARAAVERSIPLLQKVDVAFLQKTGCVSCHNNTLTAVTLASARKNGFTVDDTTARRQAKAVVAYLDDWRERALQDIGIPGEVDTIAYILWGLAEAGAPPDGTTDAMAMFLKRRQEADGRWRVVAHRPPIESSDIETTAITLRALQTYAPPAQRAEYGQAVLRAGKWLLTARAATSPDRAFQLLGMTWTHAPQERIREAARGLIAAQRADGGWTQLPSLASDAYATGQALVALRASSAVTAADPVYERGSRFLLNTQFEDGSWHVKSRVIAIQPLFESGFPHGRDQWISTAATNWAATALTLGAH